MKWIRQIVEYSATSVGVVSPKLAGLAAGKFHQGKGEDDGSIL